MKDQRKSSRPNLLFICCDDLNDAVARMGGHPQAQTPNIDRLMQRGLRFTNGQTNVPICGPSRASFLSGLGPWTSGYYGYNFGRDPWWNNPELGKTRTFMESFSEAGYKVFGTGKIFHNGQEKNEVWKDGHGHDVDWGPWSWDGQKEGSGWNACASHHSLPADWNAELLFARLGDLPDIPPNPETGAPGYKGWRHADNRPFHYRDENDRDLMHDEQNAQWAADLLGRSMEDPFCLCVGIGRPHSPLIAPDKYFDQFPLDSLELAEVLPGDVEDCAEIIRQGHTCSGRWGFQKYETIMEAGGEAMLRRWTQAYLACVAYADDCIGTVLNALESGPHAENTLVVLVSDNGYHMGEKEWLFKNSCWEESTRIPFVCAGPGVAEGAECDQPVSLVDLFPTFVERFGLNPNPHQALGGRPLDGTSLCQLLEDPQAEWSGPEVAVSVVGGDYPIDAGQPGDPANQHWSVRSKTHRYILYSNGEEELYDHEKDPMEWRNVAGESRYAAIKAYLRGQLEAQLASARAGS
ncbi:MAG: sulfatase [Opitutales bacterium]